LQILRFSLQADLSKTKLIHKYFMLNLPAFENIWITNRVRLLYG
jgi:hypothetical protein